MQRLIDVLQRQLTKFINVKTALYQKDKT
jgi:hypothetical protein